MTRSALGNSAVLGKAMALLSTLLLLSVWGAAGPVWAQSPDPTPASPPTTAPAPASPSPASPSLASPPSAAPAPIEMPDLGLGPRASVEPELEPVQPLVADLSDHLIAITTAFTGTDVLLFGATDGPGDVVMVVRGPITSKVVRRKDRIGGLVWANHDSVTFEEIPSFYRVASSRPLDEFAPEIVLQRHQIGLENLTLPLADEDAEDMDPEEQQLFR
ncbi:MAG: TIGR02186 family protein, partial [Rhodospirillaceae bacterium]